MILNPMRNSITFEKISIIFSKPKKLLLIKKKDKNISEIKPNFFAIFGINLK